MRINSEEIKRIEREIESKVLEKRYREKSFFKVFEDVFDSYTLLSLYWLINHGHIRKLNGAIHAGKESVVFSGKGSKEHIAVKIHRVVAREFKSILKYIEADFRFKKLIKSSKREIIRLWAFKEFRNLKIAEEAEVSVPRAIALKNNVIVMKLIHINSKPAPMLKEVALSNEEKERIYEKTMGYVKRLYNRGLVHGDLSEYNILYDGKRIYFIDLSQGVTEESPIFNELLERDLRNIARFFRKSYEEVMNNFNYG